MWIVLLLRNPLVRLLARLWWLPALALVAAWGCDPRQGGRWVSVGAAGLAAAAGMLSAACAHGAGAALRESARRRLSRRRFVCPYCLRFAPFRFACGTCGQEVETFVVHTNGAYVNDCPQCHALLLSHEGRGVRAYCTRCQATCDRGIYHRRQVRALATLLPADLATLRDALGARETRAHEIYGCCHDDGSRLTYILGPVDPADTAFALRRRHSLRASIETLWLDGAGIEPLELGQALDRFIFEAGLTEAQRRTMRVCVRRKALEPAAQNVLAARFGALRYGVAPADLLGGGAQPARASR